MTILLQIQAKRIISLNTLILNKSAIINKGKTILSLLILCICCSCEKTSTEIETTFFELQGENGFVGTAEGTNAFVSILLGEEEGLAYVCDGEEAISEWFAGPVTNVKEILFNNSEGAKIMASLTDNSFKGELFLRDGRNFSFNAVVNNEVYGGIYRVIDEKAVEADIKASWIVRSEEDQRGSITFQSRELPNMTLSRKNFEDIKDGTSNTVSIKGASFSIFRYKVKKPIRPAPTGPIPPFVPIPYPNPSG